MLSSLEQYLIKIKNKENNKVFTHETVVKSCKEYGHTLPSPVSRQHSCSLGWNYRCAYCELGYDDLKGKFSTLNETPKDASHILQEKIDECISRLSWSFLFKIKEFILNFLNLSLE